MFLKQDRVDPKQRALDAVLMQVVHNKMTQKAESGRESRRSMKPSYPPARNGATNYEPTFTPNPKPMNRKGGAANTDIMAVLKAYMGKVQPQTPGNRFNPQQAPPGMFNPNAPLDVSQVEDRRQQIGLGMGRPNPLDAYVNQEGTNYIGSKGEVGYGGEQMNPLIMDLMKRRGMR